MSFDQIHYGSGENGVALYARTDRDARDLVPVLRREMLAIDPNSHRPHGYALVGLHLPAAWFGSRIASSFLAVLGTISHAARRGGSLWSYGFFGKPTDSKEMGIRMALGADRGGRASDCHERRLAAGFIGDRRRASPSS